MFNLLAMTVQILTLHISYQNPDLKKTSTHLVSPEFNLQHNLYMTERQMSDQFSILLPLKLAQFLNEQSCLLGHEFVSFRY